MLELKVHDGDREVVLLFEHSLLSLSKWEEKFKKPWMTSAQKTSTELISYFQCMLLPPEDDPDLVYLLEPDQTDRLIEYMNEQRTASSVPDDGKRGVAEEIVTSELIYWWLTALRIPFQPTESWHLSRTMMLVQIAGYKQQPAKKRNPRQVMSDMLRENERRKKLLNTSG